MYASMYVCINGWLDGYIYIYDIQAGDATLTYRTGDLSWGKGDWIEDSDRGNEKGQKMVDDGLLACSPDCL